MNQFLYKLRKQASVNFVFHLLFSILISQLAVPLAWSQQPRGLFIQDGSSSGDRPSSFGKGEDEDQDSASPEGEMGMDPMTGMPGGRSAQMGDRFGLIYSVHVLGEVKRPGTYRVSPSMRVTDALRQAGNIKNNGSERFVELRKAGQAHGRVLDLFAYKTFGNMSQNPYMQDNDTIFVPLKKLAVQIEGPVKRPGVFELKSEQTLDDVIKLAGGYTVGVSQKEPIRVIRYGGYEEKEILEIPTQGTDIQRFSVQDGDVIVIPHKFLSQNQFDYNLKKLPNDNIFYPGYENRVFVIGAVRAPGAFDFNQYYTLRQYLTLAGGTTTMAKNGKIKVVAVDGKNYKAKNGNYDRVVNPGDTIIVPEKSIPTSFYIGLLPTIASLGLSATALFR